MAPCNGLRGIAVGLLVLAAGCATLPPQEGREASHVLADTAGTRLGQALAPVSAAHPGLTGIHPLTLPREAFAARMAIAGAAERSLDVQYYIWRGDQAGLLLLDALSKAAGRGVRVRLLLDDQNTPGIEDLLPALAAQPGFELRVYNPFPSRGSARALGYLGDFQRLNRRMHNKAFIADNQVAVVGGRNIGNEYFGVGSAMPFRDLDVVAVGPAVREISSQFDLYWNSASAYPAARLTKPATPESQGDLARRLAAVHDDPEARDFVASARATPLVKDILARRVEYEWAPARLVRDDPAKTLAPEAAGEMLLLTQLFEGGERPRRSLDVVSPYFVPGERGTAFLAGLARDGVRVRILTNSLATNETTVVHSGYAKRRCELARAGVQLYEFRPLAGARKADDKPERSTGGSSASHLHAKTFAVDGDRIFVGSFNFDPRSALLNTEMGLVIRSPALASRLQRTFDETVPGIAYEVRTRAEGSCVEWIERDGATEVRHETEPGAGWLRRGWLGFLEALALDWML